MRALVYHVLLHLKRKHLSPADFFRRINDKPLACHLFESYSRQQDPESLRQFYYQDDRHVDSANLSLIESFQLKDTTERINKIKESLRSYQKAKDSVFETKVFYESVHRHPAASCAFISFMALTDIQCILFFFVPPGR